MDRHINDPFVKQAKIVGHILTAYPIFIAWLQKQSCFQVTRDWPEVLTIQAPHASDRCWLRAWRLVTDYCRASSLCSRQGNCRGRRPA
jgi:hypothetical protein